ncbi:Beta-porphyranase B precursor [Rubripirellula obstinata]|uniref:Beta-porphyranase B n=1 Tax=Rubripirellula obstinata TaxID=406547 RepID=A0A5B1CMW5_9BACT|nr:family 16 glycosylhydrolase [Rubripirellula obstinata]KAA1261129.1 Beta-porphyranase B precursor [Rubripirellula obstinata]
MSSLRNFILLAVCILAISVASGAEPVPTQGLLLWLDADEPASLSVDGQGNVQAWKCKANPKNELTVNGNGRIHRIENAVAGNDAIEFDGNASLRQSALKNELGNLSIFVVSRRQSGGDDIADNIADDGDTWQRLVSSTPGPGIPDTDAPGFFVVSQVGKKGKSVAYKTQVSEAFPQQASAQTLSIAGSAAHGAQRFQGQICEVLIYDRHFQDEASIHAIRSYLAKKWNAQLTAYQNGWTRTGDLPNPPVRISDTLPLSDQNDLGGWVPVASVSDEFDGSQLNQDKWMPRSPYWLGRPPAFFHESNVKVSDGQLHLTFRKGEVPEMADKEEYHTYTSAYVRSKQAIKYGYYEVRAKPMSSAASSSFWLSGRENKFWTEIDVFEIGAGAKGFERKYNMHVHVFETPKEKRHWDQGAVWLSPWDLDSDYHVYGLQWDQHKIIWFVDGVPVARMENTDWHNSLNVIVDTESMFNWFGQIDDADLPSTYSIDYIRGWQRKSPAPEDSLDEFLTSLTDQTEDTPSVLGQQRDWTDITGRHTITATAIAIQQGWVKLKLSNGTMKDVPIDRLSKDDQQLLKRSPSKE